MDDRGPVISQGITEWWVNEAGRVPTPLILAQDLR